MFFKLTIFSVLVAFTLAGDYDYAAPTNQLSGDLSGKLNNNNNDVKDTYNIYTASEAPQSYNNNNSEDYTSYTTAQTPAVFNNGNNNNSGESTYDSYTPEPATYNNNNNEHGYNYKQYLEQEARKEEDYPKQQQQKSQQPQLKQVYQQQQQKQLDSPAFYYAPAKYDYNYAVHDDFTGDIKSHSETRDGNSVKGSYSVVDPDGYQRIVTYTADEVSGFNAVVNRVPYALPVKTVVTKTAPTEVKTSGSSVAIEPRDSYASAPKASHPDGPYA